MHKRQSAPGEEDRKWHNQRDAMQRSFYLQRPIMAYPPYHSTQTLSPAPIYPMWGQPGSQTAGVQIWGPPAYPLWHPTESWNWKPYPGVIFLFGIKAEYMLFHIIKYAFVVCYAV